AGRGAGTHEGAVVDRHAGRVHAILVTNNDGAPGNTGGLASALTVRAEPPNPTSVAPTSGRQNAAPFTVTISGTLFQASPLPQVSFGTGVAVNVTAATATSITATVTVTGSASVGAHTVTVTNADGQTGTTTFTVKAPSPTVTSISPTVVSRGRAAVA